MSSSMMLERSSMGNMPGAMPMSPMSMPGAAAMPTWCMVPRCEIRIEKCAGGCKIICCCDDEIACGTLQNLCRMLAGGMCSMTCTMNGIPCCTCNFACCNCTCEMTKDGVCITCTSGDKNCCAMVQACCDCIAKCMDCGCCCTVCFNNTPCCCSAC